MSAFSVRIPYEFHSEIQTKFANKRSLSRRAVCTCVLPRSPLENSDMLAIIETTTVKVWKVN